MTILVDLHAFADKHRTGKHTYTAQLLQRLSSQKSSDVYILALVQGSKLDFSIPEHWKVVYLPKGIAFYLVFLSYANHRMVSAILSPTSFITSLICPKPVTTIIYDLAVYQSGFVKNFKAFIIEQMLLPSVIKTSQKIITISQSVKDELAQHFPETTTNTIVINGSPRTFSSINSDVLSKYELSKDKYILYVGTIEPRKNLLNVLAGFKQMITIFKKNGKSLPTFVLAGGKGWDAKHVLNYISKNNLSSQVKVLGYVPDTDMRELYNNSCFLVYIPLYEGFGLPLIEALSFGKVSVSTNYGAMKEVIGQAGLLVNPKNSNQIAFALSALWLKPTLRINLEKNITAQLKSLESRIELKRIF